jgi:hypothetical protein
MAARPVKNLMQWNKKKIVHARIKLFEFAFTQDINCSIIPLVIFISCAPVTEIGDEVNASISTLHCIIKVTMDATKNRIIIAPRRLYRSLATDERVLLIIMAASMAHTSPSHKEWINVQVRVLMINCITYINRLFFQIPD